jgi:hypothetical protein
MDFEFGGLAMAIEDIALSRELAVKLIPDFKFKKIPTSCPCPNQPDEKVTAPGSTVSLDVFGTKLTSDVRQLGVLFGNSFWTDFFNIGSMQIVACLMEDYFKKVRYSKNIQEGMQTCCSWESNPGRYHKTIRPFASTTVRGSENFPNCGFVYLILLLSRPAFICSW